MSLQEQTKVARIVLNQLTDSINSIQTHLFAIFSLSEQWQNSQNSFTLIQASLGSHIDSLETKQKEFELRQISAENQRKQVELRQRRLDSAEKTFEERCREFEKKEKEWKAIVAMEKQKFTEWREALKLKEKRLKEVEEREKRKSLEFGENRSKELEEREIRVQERCKAVELKEKEIEERCQAIELEENRIGKKSIELERREKQLEDRCKVHDSGKKEISEGFRALELREKQLNERFVELGLLDKRINERLQELDSKEDRIKEGFSKLELKEKETKDRCQAIELEEKKIHDWCKELQRRQKEVAEGFKALEAKEKQLSMRSKGLDSKLELIKGRIQELESKESSIKEQERAIELRENETDERSKALDSKEELIKGRFQELKSKESLINEHERAIGLREKQVNEHSKALDSKEELIKGRFQELESKESLINEHEKAVKLREKGMYERLKALDSKEEMIKGRFQELELKEGLVNEHERALEMKEKELEDRCQVIDLEKEEIRKRCMELENKEKELVVCKEHELREKQLDEWFDESGRKEKQIEERLEELELKEKELTGELELKVEEIVELRRAIEAKKGEINAHCNGLDLREKEISERVQAMESKEKQSNEPRGVRVSRGKVLNGRRARRFTEKKINEQEGKNNYIIERSKEQVLKDNQLCNTESVVVKTAPYRDLHTKNEFVSLNLGEGIAGRSLQMVLNDRANDHESELLKEEIRKLLITSKNPAKLVLGALTGFFPPHLRKGHVVYEAGAVRSSCVLLLEQLLSMEPEVSKAVRKEARKVVLLWRERMRKEVSHIVVLGFLLLVAVYRLDTLTLFKRNDLKKLFEIIDGHRLAPELRLRLGLVEESNDVLHVTGPVASSTMDLCNPIEPFCSSMDADGLRTYLIEHMTKHDLFQENILDTLRDSPDPAQLVFNVVRTFDQPGSTTVNKTSCIYLLEQLMKLQNQPPRKDQLGSGEQSMFHPYQVAPNLYYEAKCFASIWRRRLATGKTEQLEIYGFLQFLATYKLAKSYDADDLFKLFKRLYDRFVYRAEQNPYLCQELGLTKKIPGFIKQLIGNNKSLQAVKYIRAFMQEHNFPLAPLLKKHVEFIQEKAVKMQFHGKPSVEKKLKAFGLELGHLRAVVHHIKVCELESQYSSVNLESRIKDLEMAIAELKPVSTEAEGDVIERAVLDIEKAREETDCTKILEEKTVEDESPQLRKDMTVTDTNTSAPTPPSDIERGSHGDLKRAASSYTSTVPPQQQEKRPRVAPSQPPLPPNVPVSPVPATMPSSPVNPPLQGYFPQPQHGSFPYGHPGHVRPIGNPVWSHNGPLPTANVPPFPASRPSHQLSSANAPPHGPLTSTNMAPFPASRPPPQLSSTNAPPHGPLTSTYMPPFPASRPPSQLSSANAPPHGPLPSTNMPPFAASRPSSHLYSANAPPPGYGVSQQMGIRPFEPAGFYRSGGPAHVGGQTWNTQ